MSKIKHISTDNCPDYMNPILCLCSIALKFSTAEDEDTIKKLKKEFSTLIVKSKTIGWKRDVGDGFWGFSNWDKFGVKKTPDQIEVDIKEDVLIEDENTFYDASKNKRRGL